KGFMDVSYQINGQITPDTRLFVRMAGRDPGNFGNDIPMGDMSGFVEAYAMENGTWRRLNVPRNETVLNIEVSDATLHGNSEVLVRLVAQKNIVLSLPQVSTILP